MFLHYFTAEQRIAFLGLVRQFILADDRYAIQEWHLFDRMKAEWHIPTSTPIPDQDLVTLAAAFTTRRTRVTALLEIIVLGYVDEHFHPTEHSFVQTLAALFGIYAGELPVFESWVQRQMALIHEARHLMAERDNTG